MGNIPTIFHQFTEHRLSEPDCLFAGAYFIVFENFDLTVNWANVVAE
jgi:hypothetical protein